MFDVDQFCADCRGALQEDQPRLVVRELLDRALADAGAIADVLEPAPGLLADILANLEEAGERHAIRSLLSGRRMAYVGGLAAATAAGAAGAIVFATRTRRARLAG